MRIHIYMHVCIYICVHTHARILHAGLESKPSRCKPCMLQFKKPKLAPVAEVKGNKGEMHKGNGRGLPIKGNGVGGALIPTGGGGVGGSSTYKITNREATRDMDWLCAISSMEG